MTDRLSTVRAYFRNNYSHVNIQGVDDETIQEFLGRDYVSKRDEEGQMNLLYDYLVSQDITDVEE
jgi:hypothetical protein